jgi:hypothetical protein
MVVDQDQSGRTAMPFGTAAYNPWSNGGNGCDRLFLASQISSAATLGITRRKKVYSQIQTHPNGTSLLDSPALPILSMTG